MTSCTALAISLSLILLPLCHGTVRWLRSTLRPSVHVAQEHILPEAKHSYTPVMRDDYNNRLRNMSKPLTVGSGLSNVTPSQQVAGTRLVYSLLEPGDD